MIKINYFDERELLVMREIEIKVPKGTEIKDTQVLPDVIPLCGGTLQQTKYSSFFLFLFLSRESTLLSCLV